MHLPDPRLSQDIRGLPAMHPSRTAEDHRLPQIPDPLDIRTYTVYRYIQRTGNMSLIVFIGRPQVDDHGARPQRFPEPSITPSSPKDF